MKKIAVLIDDIFEDVEYAKPAAAFIKAGHKLVHVGFEKGKTVTGKKAETQVCIDKSIRDVTVEDFDALFIPGGYSPDRLRVDPFIVKFVKEFVASGKPIFAICHAPQLLITAQVLRGRTVTGWKSIVQDIKNAGATYIDAEVVEDRNLITSRGPRDIPAFIKMSLKALKESKEETVYARES
ncbi:MAG TPA: type 1 glutamine amidotransferase domain-containing protein [Candidatus Thermoplasmatota archaeon]|nr:type 1 glutamine amidotransferase domain-containing protein [Candidatus Thermoplasmatota archaeon]